MRYLDTSLTEWKKALCAALDIGGLFTRNSVAHKWKATYRSLAIREGTAWRTQDLLSQSLVLHDLNHVLGARILLRSAFETVAVLIYLNQLTRSVLSGEKDFHEFSDRTQTLLLGSRNGQTSEKSLNVVTILEKCEARYPGINGVYAALSESAHPNHEGISLGYSTIDRENYITSFSNKWGGMYASVHLDLMETCVDTFFFEYNLEWPDAFEKLENWIAENDAKLEATKIGA